MKQIEEITENDLLELWSAIGGAPHLFEYGKEVLRNVIITGSCSTDQDEPIGLQLDYYTMAAIVDILRKNGYETIPQAPTIKPVTETIEVLRYIKKLIPLAEKEIEQVKDATGYYPPILSRLVQKVVSLSIPVSGGDLKNDYEASDNATMKPSCDAPFKDNNSYHQKLKSSIMANAKVISVTTEQIEFDNGLKLFSNHDSDCCEHHWLSFEHLTLSDFEGLEFDLSNDKFFNKIDGYGIELMPVSGYSVKVPGYGSNNGYYSTNLELVLQGKGLVKTYDITECQEISG